MELLGGMPGVAQLVGAFLLVLVLFGAFALLWRRFEAGPLRAMGPRGRQPRLAVLDVAAVDARRRLVLIRRDNIEHLLMIGGPTDLVVEPNIARVATSSATREPRPNPIADIPSRPGPVDGPGWPPPIEPSLRVARPLDPLASQPETERPEPLLRAPRETMPVEPTARTTRIEPGVRVPPPGPTERFRPELDDDESDAPTLTPLPPEHHADIVPEPRRPQVQPVPPPQAYEPAFQTAPVPERRSTVPPPPPPPVAPPIEAPVFQRAPEPRRVAPRPMPAPLPPEPAAAAPEPAWIPPSAALPAAQDLDQPPVRHSPVFQSTVITESKRVQTVPPKPSPSDENNLAEMAQRLEAALRRPIKPVEPAPPPPPVPVRVPAPPPVANPAARVAAYFEPPPTRGPGPAPEPVPAPVLKVVPAQDKAPSLEEEMASLLGRSTGKT
jgi:flagellar protein FliO/FliZ